MRLRFLFLLLTCQAAWATTYNVGPDQAMGKIGDVPWTHLNAGDVVLIHWSAEAYHEKWLISAAGTEAAPIIVRGVPGPTGQLPMISGENAATVKSLDYWGGERAVIKIGQGSVPNHITPTWIVLENLDVSSARSTYSFTGRKGNHANYSLGATPVWIESGNHITVRNCVLHDGANGFFVSYSSKNIELSGCYLYDNGVVGNSKVHNAYTEANGILFQGNHFGPLRKGALGNNIKDRSCGMVIRYNWIEGGNREIDLVDAEDSAAIRSDSSYQESFVYGNIIIEPQDQGNQIVHYGGDSGHTEWYRKGVLFFYNNTVISRRTDTTCLFRIQTNDEKVDCRNNIIYWTAPGKNLALVDSVGTVEMHNNWFKKGWVNCHEAFTGDVKEKNTINGDQPGFVDQKNNKFQLNSDSPCLKAAGELNRECVPVYAVKWEYLAPQKLSHRTSVADLGALGSGSK